jgi:hypothetical protein
MDMQAVARSRGGLAAEGREARFKRNVAGWGLVVLNSLAALNSTFFFLTVLKSGIVGWLMMNTCAPSIALFVIGYLLGSPVVMVAASVPMFRYGAGGLFAFGWDAYNLIPQIGHILMTLAVVYVMVYIVRNRAWKTLGLGLALGLAILIPFIILQTWWFNAHPEMLEMLFSGDWSFPSQ